MKKILIFASLSILIATGSCGPKRYLTTSRAPGIALDTINYGAYNNDPSADKARPAFIKANGPIREYNRLQLYYLEPTELAILRGATVTTAELNRIAGVTSAVQTQINGRVRSVDSTGNAAGNYVTRKALADTVTNKSSRIVRDTISNYLADATIGVALADSNIYNGGYATRTYVESLLGSGTGMTTQRLPFIIGTTTGAPTASDSTVTHSTLSGKHVNLYRDGALQYQNNTATNTVEGFRLNSDVITVNPVWQAGEQVIIDITEPVFWSSLAFEGEESTLLTNLSGYWKLDETSGTTVNDATGTQNGTTSGTVGVTGRIGYGNRIDASSEVITIPYNTNISPKGTAFTVSFWMYLDSVPSATGREIYPFGQLNNASPYESHSIVLFPANDRVTFYTRNTSGTQYGVISSGALVDSTWYHIVAINRGDGQTLQLFINGSDVSSSAGTFTGTVFEGLSNTYFGSGYAGAQTFIYGVIDECAIWSRALTSGEITTLYNSGSGRTHPFN